MTALFLQLLNMSITAGWIVLAVIVLRLLLCKAPKSMLYVLWALVAIRLLCPVSIESAFSLIPTTEPITQVAIQTEENETVGSTPKPSFAQTSPTQVGETDTVPSGGTVLSSFESRDEQASPPAAQPTETASAPIAFGVWDIAAVVWIIGSAGLLLYTAFTTWRLRQRVQVSLCVKDNVYVCDAIESPFILGVFRPRIYLPSYLTEEQIDCVLAHERAHLKRGDHLVKPFGFLLLTVYWFQPLIWLAYILFCRDMELACDERVIKTMTNKDKAVYSQTLLSCSMPRTMIAACPLAFGEVSVKSRIRSVIHYKKPAFWMIITAVIAIAIVAVCFLTDPRSSAEGDTDNTDDPQAATATTVDDSWAIRFGGYVDLSVYQRDDGALQKQNYEALRFDSIAVMDASLDGLEERAAVSEVFRLLGEPQRMERTAPHLVLLSYTAVADDSAVPTQIRAEIDMVAGMLTELTVTSDTAPSSPINAAFCIVDENGDIIVTSEDIKAAEVIWYYDDLTYENMPAVQLTMTENGTQRFAAATEENLGKTVDIMVGEEILLSPTVDAPILDGVALLRGADIASIADAQALVSVITRDNSSIVTVPILVPTTTTIHTTTTTTTAVTTTTTTAKPAQVQYYTVTFVDGTKTMSTAQVKVGDVIRAPVAGGSEAYVWNKTVPTVMPAEDLTFTLMGVRGNVWNGAFWMYELNGTLTLDSTAPNATVGGTDPPWSKYVSKITTVVIGDNVRTLSSSLLNGHSQLQTVVIGNSLETIKTGTFAGCPNLRAVTLGEKMKLIEVGAFEDVSRIAQLEVRGATRWHARKDNYQTSVSFSRSDPYSNAQTFRKYEDYRLSTSAN